MSAERHASLVQSGFDFDIDGPIAPLPYYYDALNDILVYVGDDVEPPDSGQGPPSNRRNQATW